MTAREVVSFQGAYRFDPTKPFVVDTVQKDERLKSISRELKRRRISPN